jgi:hypothetical protein
MPIITLTTDFGEKDHFVGAVKGAILSELDNVNIVDISHKISPFNIHEAAYILQNSITSFPAGTVHIIGVDSEKNPENKHVAVEFEGQYLVGADNGIISLMFSEFKASKIVEINIHDNLPKVFPVLEVFVKVACHICRGGTLEVIGKPISKLKEAKAIAPIVNTEGNQILGSVIYIDNYGNVVTNITRKFFNEIRKGRDFEISARNYKFSKIFDQYSEAINYNTPKDKRADDGKKLALFNSGGFLEIALYKSNLETVGGASTLLGLQYRDTITINFK